YAELSESLTDAKTREFEAVFDQGLCRQNPEYQDKRATRRLDPPRLLALPRGTYTRLRQQRVMEGAPEAQVKIPLLSSNNAFSNRLRLLDQQFEKVKAKAVLSVIQEV
ncbi:MAG: GH3 auxin-responsive promoter family protein, partial [Candidatus Obscuribacterales bacterium]|nr:GH3 auxin-responsive promoter family protein [Candidatus Obscuribacterales bacterium]